ncbi:MAG: hypothetical protein M1816_007376 [Peltula sp. TS41687]|nr:MAG: hypothetical protein M1816_007376 [Peltula sp. TS41687]
MVMTFFTSTRTPLYSTGWTPTTTGRYAGSCIFLIILAVLFRTSLALRQRLELYWLDRHLNRRYVVVAGRTTEKARVSGDADAKSALLVSAAGVEEDVRVVRRHLRATPPWRLSVDLPRALLGTVMAGIGYLLMLAVMTCNVGYFLSVLAGVFLGELLVGRYTQMDEH